MGSPSLIQRWWRAIRPHSLRTAVGPVLVGGSVALDNGAFRAWAFGLILIGLALLLIGMNLVNDYFDYRNGADPPIGVGTRALQTGLLAPRSFLLGGCGAIGIGGLIGMVLSLQSPVGILPLGLAGALLGFFYTAPPLKLGYRGLGEIVVFGLLGPAATFGAHAVTANRLALEPVLASLPIAFAVTAILHANNLRDYAADAATGKRTLAVRLGAKWAIKEMYVLVWAAEGAVLVVALTLTPIAGLGLLTLPRVWRLRGTIEAGVEPGRRLMVQTSALHFELSFLLAVGFVVDAVLKHPPPI
jgi:1,4-dihydroxy-2-naphthoate octaprenyltransferase